MGLPELMMVAPDTGGTKRASAYAKHLGVDMAICYKQRKVANRVDSMTVIGDVEGKDVVLVDDMVDTAGTMTTAADLMSKLGARSVRAIATHAVLSGEAIDRLERSAITELIVTDTIPLSRTKLNGTGKIKQLTVAQLFADVIRRVRDHESISSHFIIA
jgi:ribose-phosphate pyrophosphokinase